MSEAGTPPTPDRYKEPNMRAEMTSSTQESIASLGAPLITIDEKNLDATARWPSVAHWATLRLIRRMNSRERPPTVESVMQGWDDDYGRISIGYKGKARDEYGKFANLAAAGGGTLVTNDAAMQDLLNEGSRKVDTKSHWYSRGKK